MTHAIDLPLQRYTRVSKTGKRKLLHSHDMQDATIGAMAGRYTLPLTASRIEDTDRSGKDFNREGWRAAMTELREGRIRGIAVATLDRFARDIAEGFAMLKEIQAANGELWVDDAGGRIDLADDMSLMNFAMRLVIGQIEYQRKAKGLEQSRRLAIETAGRHLAPTFGYDRPDVVVTVNTPSGPRQMRTPMVPNRDAATVKRAFELRAERMSWARIADALNADDRHKLADGGLWTWGRVRSMVRSKTYLGIAKSGEFVNPDAHDAIVSDELWHRANWVGSGPTPDAERDEWLLTGLIRCGACGYRMRPKTNGNGERYYKCKRKHRVGECPTPVGSLNADNAEAYVWESVAGEIAARKLTGADANGVQAEDAAYDRAKRRWQYAEGRAAEAFADAADVADEMRELADEAKAALNAAAQQRDAAHTRRLGIDNVPSMVGLDLDALPMDDRKALIAAVYPAIFARRSEGWRDPIAKRLDLRNYAPAGLPGGRSRMVAVRSYFV